MARTLHVDPSAATPIWSQIEEGVRHLVASGALTAGSPVPSVRDLARDLRVNPATVAKAYQRLSEQGLLTVKRGEGTYVSDRPPAMKRGELNRALKEGASRYASLAVTIGASSQEAAEALASAWKELRDGAKGGER